MPNEIPVVFHNGSNYDFILSLKNWQTNLRRNLNIFGKKKKSGTFFPFQQKKESETLINMIMKVLSVYLTKKIIDSA